MKTSSVVAVVVALVVIAGAVWWIVAQPATTPAQNTAPAPAAAVVNAPASTAPMSVTVTYGPNGFSPSTVTIAKGGTVTFAAALGADEMWVASNPHPTHTGYDGTDRATHCAAGYRGPAPFDQCSAGTSFSFTFNKAGTWGYHNHGNHSDTGTVVVQ